MMRRQGGKSVTGAERICERMRSAVHPTYMSTLYTVVHTYMSTLYTVVHTYMSTLYSVQCTL